LVLIYQNSTFADRALKENRRLSFKYHKRALIWALFRWAKPFLILCFPPPPTT
jgi:hypothetical protein